MNTAAGKVFVRLTVPFLAIATLVFLFTQTSTAVLNSEEPMWAGALNITANGGTSNYSKVVLDNLGNVHVIWRDNSVYPYDTQVFYRLRSAAGDWSPINVVPNSNVYVGIPDASTDLSGTLHVVWRTSSIQYAEKPLTGSWSMPIAISDLGSSNDPDIETGIDGSLHVMWGQGTYRERTPAGTWLNETTVFPGVQNLGSVDIAVADDGTVHAVIGDANTNDIYYASRAPGGTWTAPLNVSSNPTASSVPLVDSDANGDVHIVWKDVGGPDNYDTFYTARISGTWTPVTNISNVSGESYRQRMAVAPDGAVHVVWNETGAGVAGCYYTGKPSSGAWTTPEHVAYGGCEIAVAESGDVHWLWPEDNTLHHRWRTPSSPWSSYMVHTVSDLSYISMSAGPGHSLHAVWSGKPSPPGNLDTFYASFYRVTVSAVSPITLTNCYSNTLLIYGSGFFSTSQVYLGETQLLPVMFGSTSELTARVPLGFPAGLYPVTIRNPDGVYGEGTQLVAVKNPTPIVSSVAPTETFNVVESVLDVFGEHFVDTPAVFLGPQELPRVQWQHSGHLSATVPKSLASGWYPLTVANPGPGTPSYTLPNALYVKLPWKVLLPLVLKRE